MDGAPFAADHKLAKRRVWDALKLLDDTVQEKDKHRGDHEIWEGVEALKKRHGVSEISSAILNSPSS